jgi:hypothetical protein
MQHATIRVYSSYKEIDVWLVCRPLKNWAADEWHNKGPQHLVTLSLCMEIAISKIQLCSLSIACVTVVVRIGPRCNGC